MKFSRMLAPFSAGLVVTVWPDPLPAQGLEMLMGVPPGEHAVAVPHPDSPRTAFFLAEAYQPTLAVPTDAVQLYAGIGGSAALVGAETLPPIAAAGVSWNQKGYATELFLHSRYGHDVRNRPAEYQRDRQDQPFAVIGTSVGDKQVDLAIGPLSPGLVAAMKQKHGPGAEVRELDHYTIPTQGKIDHARLFYEQNLRPEMKGFCFDEPEIWTDAGYSDAFKAEWRAHYGGEWMAPHSSVDARYKAEQLKRFLVRRWVETILTDVATRRPDITRLIATHSQSSYAGMGMGAHHYALFTIPVLNEVVAEVWNEPFDSCYAQYSSFWHQIRGSDKRLWLMMDPWGDSPAMSLDYYRRSYGANVVAAMMFPAVERFQPLIWPNRLYGHIPPEYETIINSVTGVLTELWRHPDGSLRAGTDGIATFVADSMSWQRAEPAPSDLDGFDGFTLSLIRRGLPVDVLPLERVGEKGFLDRSKAVLLSYDYLKPTDLAQNQALSEWTRAGGVLICFGGTDAYNTVREAWWTRAGYASPLEELFSRLGLPLAHPTVLDETGRKAEVEPTEAGLANGAFSVPVGPSSGERQYHLRKSVQTQVETAATLSDPTYPLTVYAPPSGAHPLYRLKSTGQPVVWSARVGRGMVIFAGIAPGFLKTSAAGSELLATLVRHALAARGDRYEETDKFVLKRGPYVAVRTFATTHELPGRYVDVFSPTLEVRTNPIIPAQSNALLVEVDAGGREEPRAVSGRLVSWYASATTTALVVRAPAHTNGVTRLATGGRRLRSAQAWTTEGRRVALQAKLETDSLLLEYPNKADGVVLRINWDPGPASR